MKYAHKMDMLFSSWVGEIRDTVGEAVLDQLEHQSGQIEIGINVLKDALAVPLEDRTADGIVAEIRTALDRLTEHENGCIVSLPDGVYRNEDGMPLFPEGSDLTKIQMLTFETGE
tara:strand:+ start:31713 stop:32057 length:345 start_codon:yes stop_codon:yes gene_type:complete